MTQTFHRLLFMTLMQVFFLEGCTTSFLPNIIIKPNANVTNTPFETTNTANAKIIISQIEVNISSTLNNSQPSPSDSPKPGSGPRFIAKIFFDAVKSQDTINSHCAVSAVGGVSQKPCFCQFSWGDLTTTDNSTSSVPRRVQTPLISIQPNLVTCNAPSVWSDEIIDGTRVNITVVPSPLNPESGAFSVSKYSYTKSSKATSGSFQDLAGNFYDNVYHYACYQKFKRGMQIVSKVQNITNPRDSNSYRAYFASRFCVARAGSSASTESDCSASTRPDFSSQSYYFNLYIRNSERGDINLFNTNFICPRVKENLDPDPISGRTGQVWPLDTTFSLAIGPTSTFVIGVEANTKLGSNTDPYTGPNTCFPPANGGGGGDANGQDNSTTIVKSCLGFAAKPHSDGTCPYIQDSNQQIVPTFRLRRYFALYPRVYDTDGKPLQGQDQAIDTVYVLDRPVNAPNNIDHLRPYTMLGPKPCPFAFFDRKGVTRGDDTAIPIPTTPLNSPVPLLPGGYVSTSDPRWTDVNIDGIEFPNIDGKDEDSINQCSAILPYLTINSSGIREYVFRTINRYNKEKATRHAYIRPIKPFIPHYEEDKNFLACAPQAKPLNDPPLHFSRDPLTGNVAWCSESYPTQNPNIQEFDKNGIGVIPFTSHVVSNSSSQPCSATLLNYPSNYTSTLGKHNPSEDWMGTKANFTCDRTVSQIQLDDSNTPSSEWPRFPLLAHATAIESSIIKDKSYFCTITYDGGGEKTGRSSPSTGCCASSSVQLPTLSLSGSGASSSASNTATAAHLESDIGCNIPNY